MAKELQIREFTMDDYDRVWQLWQVCKIPGHASNARAEVEKKVRRDPDLFLVAELNRVILGVVMGGWDGRTGWVYNHAVDPTCRRMHIGSQLLQEVGSRLWAKGALQISLWVARDSLEAQDFYHTSGFEMDQASFIMSKRRP